MTFQVFKDEREKIQKIEAVEFGTILKLSRCNDRKILRHCLQAPVCNIFLENHSYHSINRTKSRKSKKYN